MDYCSSCDVEIAEDAAYCAACGAEQGSPDAQVERDSVDRTQFVVTLCILTIIGSVLGMTRGWFYEFVTTVLDFDSTDDYSRGWGYIVVHFGTLVGAIAMMLRKKWGLLLYTVCQLIYLVMVAQVAAFAGGSGMMLALPFFFPSAVFLAMYWLPVNRETLR